MIGIYHDGAGAVLYYGYRKPQDIPGASWRTITSSPERALLEGVRDLRRLKWDGAAVVLRSQAELDAIEAADNDAGDGNYLDDPRVRAFLTILLDELNLLRQLHGLAPRTPAQARAAIKAKIDELRAL